MNIKEKVIEVIQDQLNVHPDLIKMDTKLLYDLGADSLDAVELVMAFEEEYGIEIIDQDAEACETVQDLIAFLERVTS